MQFEIYKIHSFYKQLYLKRVKLVTNDRIYIFAISLLQFRIFIFIIRVILFKKKTLEANLKFCGLISYIIGAFLSLYILFIIKLHIIRGHIFYSLIEFTMPNHNKFC